MEASSLAARARGSPRVGGKDNWQADREAAEQIRDTRVVYADNDPVIHAHANALLTGTGTTRIILADLRDALPPGSFLALSHGTTDFHPAEVTGTATTTYDSATAPLVLRPRAAIEAFLAGFTAEPPGLVQASLWHPDKIGRAHV